MNRDGIIPALIAARSHGEREALGMIDCIGPIDPPALALALGWSVGEAAGTLQRLIATGLVVLRWERDRRRPWFDLAPALHTFHTFHTLHTP